MTAQLRLQSGWFWLVTAQVEAFFVPRGAARVGPHLSGFRQFNEAYNVTVPVLSYIASSRRAPFSEFVPKP